MEGDGGIGRGSPVRVEDHSPATSTEKRPRETRGGGCITGMMNDPQVA